MKRWLVCVTLACAVWGWAPGAGWGQEFPVVEVAPGPKLYELSWTEQPPTTAELDAHCSNLGERDPFTAGQCDLQLMSGLYNRSGLGPGGPRFDYVPIAFRFGYMVTSPLFDQTWARGNVEALLEAQYGPVIKEFGHYIVGPDLIFRYNFVQPECPVVPYIQGGAGFVITDGYKWPSPYQRLIGEQFEFLLRAEVGVRFMVTDCVSLDVEGGYQHISNARLAPHNAGVNNVGFTVGLTYFFGKPK